MSTPRAGPHQIPVLRDVIAGNARIAADMEQQMQEILRAHEERAAEIGAPEERALDPETVEKLGALGYIEEE